MSKFISNSLSGGQVPDRISAGLKTYKFAIKITKSLEYIALFLIFAPELLYETIMCTVNIKVNEAVLRNIRPELKTTSAIRQWVQQQIDLRIQQIAAEQRQNETQEDLWRAIEQDEELLLKPSEIVDDCGEAIELESFRADLHRMIDEVYAEQ